MDPAVNRNIDEQLQFIQVLHQGHNSEDVLQKYLEQQQSLFQQTEADTLSKLQERQIYVLKNGKGLVDETSSLNVFKPAKLQIENLAQTLNRLQQNQHELKQELHVEQQRLESMQMKKNELLQSLHGMQQVLRSSEAKGSLLEDLLYNSGKYVSAYISSRKDGEKK